MNNYNQFYGRQDNLTGASWNYPPQTSSNKCYVISLDDAINRAAPRNSEMVYFHQDLNEFYVIKTDFDGRKSWAQFTYSVPNQDLNTPATKADIKELLARIERLECKEDLNNE